MQCVICKSNDDSASHILFDCPSSLKKFGRPPTPNNKNLKGKENEKEGQNYEDRESGVESNKKGRPPTELRHQTLRSSFFPRSRLPKNWTIYSA